MAVNITHIEEAVCPHCGAPAREERLDGSHAEWRAFKCGLGVAWDPDEGSRHVWLCKQSEDYCARCVQRKAVCDYLDATLATLYADEFFLDEARRTIQTLRYRANDNY